MSSVYGDVLTDDALGRAALSMVFEPDLAMGWSDCGATADFLGTMYAKLAAASGRDANDARHSINYLANELLENAVKFRRAEAGTIRLDAALEDGVFRMRLSNTAEAANAGRFKALLAEITARDAGELLLERIEANAMAEGSGSGLGILTMMNDYGAKMGWRFEETGGGVRVETHAALTLA